MHKSKYVISTAILVASSIAPLASAASYSDTVAPFNVTSDDEITLSNATVDARSSKQLAGITIQPGTTLTLNLEGDNYIYGGTCAAGILVSPKYNDKTYDAAGSAKLIIKGSGNLTVLGGRGQNSEENSSFQCGTGAGIGGNGSYSEWDGRGSASDGVWDWNYGPDFGEVTIDSDFTGTLNATGGKTDSVQGHNSNQNDFDGGAGIGTGGTVAYEPSPDYHETLNGKINIKNGTINASGLAEGASDRVGGGAGIGTGSGRGDGGIALNNVEINISGGTIKADGGMLASGIGGGSNQNSGFINISGGKIVSKYGPYEESNPTPSGAGIGAGDCGTVQKINITGGDITATGLGSAGIGGGYEETSVASAIYSENDDYGRAKKADGDESGIINISGANTKVLAIGESIDDYDPVDRPGYRVKSGSGIGSGAPYQYSDNWQPVYYKISITDKANVTAIGGKYANAIGTGGTYFERLDDKIVKEYGAAITIDDTVTLFAANGSTEVPALPQTNEFDDFRGITPVSFTSSSKYLVEKLGDDITAKKTVPGNDSTSASYSLSGTTMTATVEGNEATTHETTANYTDGNNFALISGKEAEPDTPDTPDTPDAPDTPDTPDTPDAPDTPDSPKTYDNIIDYIKLSVASIAGLAVAVIGFIRSKKH